MRKGFTAPRYDRPADDPALIAHYRLPSDEAIEQADQRARAMAEIGSEMLLRAIEQYKYRNTLREAGR